MGLRDAILALSPSAYWPLNETSGSTWYDVSGNGHNITGAVSGDTTPTRGGAAPYATADPVIVAATVTPTRGRVYNTVAGTYTEVACSASMHTGLPFSIGSQGFSGRDFKGNIAEVAIWPGVELTPDQIMSVYKSWRRSGVVT